MGGIVGIRNLGVYVLPGRVTDPTPGIAQAIAAEQIGFGSIWISERWERKEIGVICGALGHATSRINIVAGMTHFGTRHPVVLAGLGTTMQALTGGRFMLGIARSSPDQWRNLGLVAPNLAGLADHAGILKRLWAGETIDHDGPAGRFPNLRFATPEAKAPPLLLAAIGPKTLELAGRSFDGVVLHPFLTVEGVARSVAIARRAAEEAGRDPTAFQVVAAVVVAPDMSREERLATVEGRAVTYFSIPDVGGAVIKVNGWDDAPMRRLIDDPEFAKLEFQGLSHQDFLARMNKAAAMLPALWADEGAAAGDSEHCARRLRDYRDAGVDKIVLHGTTAERLGDVVRLYSAESKAGDTE